MSHIKFLSNNFPGVLHSPLFYIPGKLINIHNSLINSPIFPISFQDDQSSLSVVLPPLKSIQSPSTTSPSKKRKPIPTMSTFPRRTRSKSMHQTFISESSPYMPEQSQSIPNFTNIHPLDQIPNLEKIVPNENENINEALDSQMYNKLDSFSTSVSQIDQNQNHTHTQNHHSLFPQTTQLLFDKEIQTQSYYMGKEFNLVKIAESLSGILTDFPDCEMFSKNNRISVTFPKEQKYIVFRSFGVVTFVNFSMNEIQNLISRIFPGSKDLDRLPSEDIKFFLHKSAPTWFQSFEDGAIIQNLNLTGVELISLLLSQSIMLEFLEKEVDQRVDAFGKMNETVKITGELKKKPSELFVMVAEMNSIYSQILHLGILQRSETAWNNQDFHDLWSHFYEDFEFKERFERVDWKISLVQQSIKFFMEIAANQKSNFLEWMIILLISTEIIVGLWDVHVQMVAINQEQEFRRIDRANKTFNISAANDDDNNQV